MISTAVKENPLAAESSCHCCMFSEAVSLQKKSSILVYYVWQPQVGHLLHTLENISYLRLQV